MNELLLSYDDLKRLHDEDKLNTLSQKNIDKLKHALLCWYGTTPFEQVNEITGIDPFMGNDEDGSCDKLLDEARKIWNKMDVSEQLTHFIDLCDDGDELAKYIDN